MKTQELYSSINLPEEIRRKLEQLEKKTDLKQWEPHLERMTHAETAAEAYRTLDDLLSEDPDHLQMLLGQLECARRCSDRYQEKGISADIFTDTMKCFSRFIGECGRRYGRLYWDRSWWVWRQVSMSLFRIGALEYEFTTYDEKPAISIHIPSDADFSPESVDLSLAQARRFFAGYYPEYPLNTWFCDSWLLSPALTPLLSKDSHILSFQRRFRILTENSEARDYLEWLYAVPPDTPLEELPERTGLQRRVKKLLLSGGKSGTACGILEAGSSL